jgi:hypothetical protein
VRQNTRPRVVQSASGPSGGLEHESERNFILLSDIRFTVNSTDLSDQESQVIFERQSVSMVEKTIEDRPFQM